MTAIWKTNGNKRQSGAFSTEQPDIAGLISVTETAPRLDWPIWSQSFCGKMSEVDKQTSTESCQPITIIEANQPWCFSEDRCHQEVRLRGS